MCRLQVEAAVRDTCGQDRTVLGDWFVLHGRPELLLPPAPPLTRPVLDNPYSDPANPPPAPPGVCGVRWSDTETELETGYKRYQLANFTGEAECGAAGFNVTHAGHCGACSTLQVTIYFLHQSVSYDDCVRIWVCTYGRTSPPARGCAAC